MSARARRALVGTPYRLVLFDGDSLTYGLESTGGQTYPAQCMALLPAAIDSTNFGIPSQLLATMLANAPSKIDPYFDLRRPKQVVVIWGGTNDLSIGTAEATVYSNTVAYCQARQAAGFKVVVLTTLPRTGNTVGNFETLRQSLNTSIRSNWATFADALADVGNDPTIGQAGDTANLTYYYTDGIHLINAGYAIVAAAVASALTGLL